MTKTYQNPDSPDFLAKLIDFHPTVKMRVSEVWAPQMWQLGMIIPMFRGTNQSNIPRVQKPASKLLNGTLSILLLVSFGIPVYLRQRLSTRDSLSVSSLIYWRSSTFTTTGHSFQHIYNLLLLMIGVVQYRKYQNDRYAFPSALCCSYQECSTIETKNIFSIMGVHV